MYLEDGSEYTGLYQNFSDSVSVTIVRPSALTKISKEACDGDLPQLFDAWEQSVHEGEVIDTALCTNATLEQLDVIIKPREAGGIKTQRFYSPKI